MGFADGTFDSFLLFVYTVALAVSFAATVMLMN